MALPNFAEEPMDLHIDTPMDLHVSHDGRLRISCYAEGPGGEAQVGLRVHFSNTATAATMDLLHTLIASGMFVLKASAVEHH
jgi:hypothetical protein